MQHDAILLAQTATAAVAEWPKLVWVIDPGDKRAGITVLRQQKPRAKFELFMYDNLHLFPKHIPTMQELEHYYGEHSIAAVNAEAQLHIQEASDRTMHKERAFWHACYQKFDEWLVRARIERNRARDKIQRRLKRLNAKDLEGYTALQLQLKENGDTEIEIVPPPEFTDTASEQACASLEHYRDALQNTKSSKLRYQYYMIAHCFGPADLKHFCELHSEADKYGETDTHYAAPHHTGLKINRIIPVLIAYGCFWEAFYGIPSAIVLERQEVVFGQYNFSTEMLIAGILSAAPWRANGYRAPVRELHGGRKGKVMVLREEELNVLRNMGKMSAQYWTQACHPVYINLKAPSSAKARSALPRLFPKNEKVASKPKVVVQIEGVQGSRARHVQRQLAIAAAGGITAAEQRQQNKKDAVNTATELLENYDNVTRHVLVGYKWFLRAKYYWTEHQKRDPADAILTAIYALTHGSHADEEDAAEERETKKREKERERRRNKKRKSPSPDNDDDDNNTAAQPPPPPAKRRAKKTAVTVVNID